MAMDIWLAYIADALIINPCNCHDSVIANSNLFLVNIIPTEYSITIADTQQLMTWLLI